MPNPETKDQLRERVAELERENRVLKLERLPQDQRKLVNAASHLEALAHEIAQLAEVHPQIVGEEVYMERMFNVWRKHRALTKEISELLVAIVPDNRPIRGL